MNILRTILTVIFLISACAIIIIVLMQEGKSAGLGVMGGTNAGNSYWERNKKHSLEGQFEQWTKITAVIFILSAFLIMLIPNETPIPAYPDLIDEILPAPVDGGNEEVDANGQPKEDAVNNVTPQVVIPENNGESDTSIIAPGETTDVTPETSDTANTTNDAVTAPEETGDNTDVNNTADNTETNTTENTTVETDNTVENTTPEADTTETNPAA